MPRKDTDDDHELQQYLEFKHRIGPEEIWTALGYSRAKYYRRRGDVDFPSELECERIACSLGVEHGFSKWDLIRQFKVLTKEDLQERIGHLRLEAQVYESQLEVGGFPPVKMEVRRAM